MIKPVPEKIARAALKERRQEVEQRLAAFGLARGPRRLLRDAGRGAFEAGRTRRLRAALESLGPVFSAFGLYLSTRVDLLPAPDCLELAAIRDRAEASPPSAVRSLISRELGRAQQDLFFTFEERPFESRLMSQSHRALLADGQEVVVRVIRPEAEEYLRSDAALLPLLKVGFADGTLSGAAFESAVEDFCHTLRRQINCVEEAKVFEALVQDATEFGMLRVPVVYGALCTPRLLTVERLPGASLGHVIPFLRPEEEEAAGPARERIDREDLARQLCSVWLRQAFLGRFFPVEPSADNITVLPNKQIAFTGGGFDSLPPGPKANLCDYLVAAATDDPDRAYFCLFRELTKEGPPAEHDDLRQRFRQIVPLRDGGWATSGDGNSLAENLFAHWRLAGARGHLPPPHLSSFYRGLFLVAGVARRLAPERDALSEGLQDVRLLTGVEKFRDMVDPRHLGDQLERYGPILMELPQRLDEVLTLAAEGRAGLKIQMPETAAHRRRKNSSAIVVALLLVLAAFALLSPRLAASFTGAWVDGFNAVVFVALGGLLLRAASRA